MDKNDSDRKTNTILYYMGVISYQIELFILEFSSLVN